MKYLPTLFLVLFATLFISCSATERLQKKQIGLINNVAFTDSSFDNDNASNGFLVQYNNQTYGITAKHVLMIAKTDNMQFVDFGDELKQWRMHPKDNASADVVMGELLSTNQKDSLTWDYLFNNWETYDDWLVFSVKENTTKHKMLKFRTKPLAQGEPLYAIGWSYSDTTGTQRVYEYIYQETSGNFHNLVQVKGPEKLGGLSGAPIVDKKGAVVGLVTSGGEDEETKEIILEATSMENVMKFLATLE
ncbi:MAG: trypsin-like peptidase domain-containing protein [Saprospiraceae bacterium]